MTDAPTYPLKNGETVINGVLFGWTGAPCAACGGHGETVEGRRCPSCGGTGDAYGRMPQQPDNLPSTAKTE